MNSGKKVAAITKADLEDRPKEVKIVDMEMSFGNMIVFMVKWAIASIPALIILGVIFAVGWSMALTLILAAFKG